MVNFLPNLGESDALIGEDEQNGKRKEVKGKKKKQDADS